MNATFNRGFTGRLARLFFLFVMVIFSLGHNPRPAQSIMAGQGLMWTVWQSAPVRLVVCWANPGDAEPNEDDTNPASGAIRREWARLAVKRTWERYARVIFVGWQPCQDEANAAAPPNSHGPRRPGTLDENLKITITYSGSSSNWGHGSYGDYAQDGVRLNLHCGGQTLKACIEYLAIHEFGHTLGYYHEEERSDWPTNIPGCPRQTYSPNGVWWPIPTELQYGSYDPSSVMAYCSGAPTSLSPKDIGGVQRAYTRRQPGTLLSVPGSLCLSAHAAGSNGEPAFGWECDEALNDQEWIYDREKLSLSIFSLSFPPKIRCLDVDTVSNSNVQAWDCHYGANQQWSFRRVQIRGYGGLCLTRPASGAGPVKMQACTGVEEQLWRLSPGAQAETFTVASESDNMCLVAWNAAGTQVAVEGCLKSYLPVVQKRLSLLPFAPAGQEAALLSADTHKVSSFTLRAGGQIGIPSSEPSPLCMDVQDVWDSDYRAGLGGPAAGQNVQAFQCFDTQLNQRWNLSGDVTSGDRCLMVTGDRTANGAGAAVGACNNSVEQDWDYYW